MIEANAGNDRFDHYSRRDLVSFLRWLSNRITSCIVKAIPWIRNEISTMDIITGLKQRFVLDNNDRVLAIPKRAAHICRHSIVFHTVSSIR
jgi:hypothetical protein